MGTRSNIGIENRDGSVSTIRCHYDGYPSFTGKRLLQTFYNREFAEALVSEGDRSCLYNDDDPKEKGILCNGEPPRGYGTVDQWMTDIKDAFIEYCYLFRQDEKWYYTCKEHNSQFVLLTDQCCLVDNA